MPAQTYCIALEFQHRQTVPAAAKWLVGNTLVTTGEITNAQLEEGPRRQAESGRRLGDELVHAGYVHRNQVDAALSLQRRLIAAVLLLALALSAQQKVHAAEAAAGGQTTKLTVMARVAAFFRLQVQHQATGLSITQQDIERGYVEAPAASRFSVSTNSPGNYVIDFRPNSDVFRAVQINGLNRVVELSADGGTVVANASQVGTMTHELTYRFVLHPQVSAGDYPWPLTLAVHPL